MNSNSSNGKKIRSFSKRLGGLFNTASELCDSTGTEAAVLVVSSGGQVFAFGHPNADAVLDKYLSSRNVELRKELEQAKNRNAKIEEARSGNGGGLKWEEVLKVDQLGVEELRRYCAALDELLKKVVLRIDELRMMKADSPINPTHHCYHSDSAAPPPPPSSGLGDPQV